MQGFVSRHPFARLLYPRGLALKIASNPASQERVVFGQDEGGTVRLAFDDEAFLLELIEQGWVEVPDAAPENEQLCAFHGPNGIDLQAVDLAQQLDDALFGGRRARCGQPLGSDGQAARFGGSQGNWLSHLNATEIYVEAGLKGFGRTSDIL